MIWIEGSNPCARRHGGRAVVLVAAVEDSYWQQLGQESRQQSRTQGQPFGLTRRVPVLAVLRRRPGSRVAQPGICRRHHRARVDRPQLRVEQLELRHAPVVDVHLAGRADSAASPVVGPAAAAGLHVVRQLDSVVRKGWAQHASEGRSLESG